MSIELKQFDGSTITPKDDAIMYEILTGVSGIISGCDLTAMGGGVIKIGSGRGIIKGRQFVVQEESISVELAAEGDKLGRIYFHMDLSNDTAPIQMLYVTANELPELVQDENCNETNGIYEIELGTYKASMLAVSDLQKTITTIEKSWENFSIKKRDDILALTMTGYLADAMIIKQMLQVAGYFLGPYTIPAGVAQYEISDASITATSIVEIYPKNYDDTQALSDAGTYWAQTDGSVTLLFESATAAAINLQYVCVRNIDGNAPAPTPTPTTAEYGSITELETTTFDYSFSGDFAEKTEEG